MSDWNKNEAMKCQVDFMEKEIIYFKGVKREKARKVYLAELCVEQKVQFLLRENNQKQWSGTHA